MSRGNLSDLKSFVLAFGILKSRNRLIFLFVPRGRSLEEPAPPQGERMISVVFKFCITE